MRELLLSVIRTLDLIELRGQDNMARLLGCIRILTDMAEQAEDDREDKETT